METKKSFHWEKTKILTIAEGAGEKAKTPKEKQLPTSYLDTSGVQQDIEIPMVLTVEGVIALIAKREGCEVRGIIDSNVCFDPAMPVSCLAGQVRVRPMYAMPPRNPGVMLEELPDENKEGKEKTEESKQVRKPLTLEDFTDSDFGL